MKALLLLLVLAAPALAEETAITSAPVPAVSLFRVDVTGAGEVDETGVRDGLGAQVDAIRACWDKAAAKVPEARRDGVVLAFVRFDAKGKVTSVEAGGRNDAATACVTAAFKKARLRTGGVKGVATARLFLDVSDTAAGGLLGRDDTGAPPAVDAGDATVTGSLDRAIIRRYVQQRRKDVADCYDAALAADPNLGAVRLSVEFVIDPAGAVTSATATGDGPAALRACVAKAIQAVTFPKPAGGGVVKVTYPYVFQPAR